MPTQTASYYYRDYPPISGLYSYAMAHLGLHAEVGKKSPWITVLFKNAPLVPGLVLSQTSAQSVSVKISNINNITGIIIKRAESISGVVQKIDTIYASEFNKYEMTTTYPQSLIYVDTLLTAGAYSYTVNTFNMGGSLSKDGLGALFFPAELPTPLPPIVTTAALYISVSSPSTVTSAGADSMAIYRAKDSLKNFVLLRTIPVAWTSSINDSVYPFGSGKFYYKIKTIKNGFSSDFSMPVEAYYSGLLETPGTVKLGADSTTVKITVPQYGQPMDSLIVYRVTAGGNEFTAIKKFGSSILSSTILVDSVKQAAVFSYTTKAFYKNLVSLFSTIKSVSVPGSGYRIFIAPTTGDTLKLGTTSQIKWNPNNIQSGYIRLALYIENTRIQDIATLSTGGTVDGFTWNIPASLTPGTTYTIKMVDNYSDELLDQSAVFSIVAQ
jgi:hypothetical protein